MSTLNALRRFTPIPFTQVRVEDGFWAPRMRVNRERTLRAVYRQSKETGRTDAFRLDWQPGKEPKPHIFWDSDVAKWVEAASYSLATHSDPELESLVEEVVTLIVAAQQPDGYLNVYYTVVEPEKRWSNLRDCHELYSAGHLIEAAVAHYQATGNRKMLDALCRYADYIDSVFGLEPGKKRGYCGHEEIELALVKLYHVTGNERYLRLSQYFVEERGQQPSYFELEAQARGEDPKAYWGKLENLQAHAPVREQREAVGHAVRAMYLYSAMADLAGELNDPSLLIACEHLWESACLRKMYVTGGVGSSAHGERFTTDYDLPNDTAYAETCAAIGLVLWNHRMLQFDCDSRYADVMERALYNGVLSGVSLDGEKFFYVNPLASDGTHHRQQWFACACCPSNLARLMASLGGYVYSQSEDAVAVHLYMQGQAKTTLANGVPVVLRQETRYPWEGQVRIGVGVAQPTELELRFRIPGWCQDFTLCVDGELLMEPDICKGYACVRRRWQRGDEVELDFAMPAMLVEAHPAVVHDFGRVALQRGPVVYCIEGVDHPVSVKRIIVDDATQFQARYDPDLLGGVVVLEAETAYLDEVQWGEDLYRRAEPRRKHPVTLRAIPYCTWDNRAPGEMVVWIPRV